MPSPWRTRHAAAVIRSGGFVAHPTEGVWGLACDPDNAAAVADLLRCKRRSWRQGLILVAADEAMLAPWVEPLPEAARAELTAAWPGPTTFLVPNRGIAPAWITGPRDTVALRVTAHPLAAALSREFGGPIVSTSANRSGRPAARDALTVRRQLGDEPDLYLHGELGGASGPSRIVDLASGAVLR